MSYKAKLLMSLKNKSHHTHISPVFAENKHKKNHKIKGNNYSWTPKPVGNWCALSATGSYGTNPTML